MSRKTTYEENPWRDDPPGKLVAVDDFLPSPAAFRKLRVKLEQAEGVIVPVTQKERKLLEKQAKKVGLSAEGLLAGIVRDYVQHLPMTR